MVQSSPPPVLELSPPGSLDEVKLLAKAITERLRQYPYYCVVSGLPPVDEKEPVAQIIEAMAELPNPKQKKGLLSFLFPPPALDRSIKENQLSFTRIRINKDSTVQGEQVTRYSRTNQALEIHSDSSNKRFPHELVAFQMVKHDEKGGDSLMLAVKDLLELIPKEQAEILFSQGFPLGKTLLPILWGSWEDPKIRYFKRQLETAEKNFEPMPPPMVAAVKTLDELLENHPKIQQFKVKGGDILFMDNTRAMHGRTGFAKNSQRLMLRYRMRMTCLG